MKLLLANLLVLFTLTGSLHALGAEAETAPTDDEPSATAAEQTAEDETEADTAPSTDDTAGTEDTEDTENTEEVSAPPLNPNEPFVPSVQISEDLSVSFPVDI